MKIRKNILIGTCEIDKLIDIVCEDSDLKRHDLLQKFGNNRTMKSYALKRIIYILKHLHDVKSVVIAKHLERTPQNITNQYWESVSMAANKHHKKGFYKKCLKINEIWENSMTYSEN